MLEIKEYISLKELTTFKIGGEARYFCSPKDINELKEALLFAKDNSLNKYFLGGGSNLLFADGLINALVISTIDMNRIEIEGDRAIAQSGVTIDHLNERLLESSLSGMEFSGGLPGSLGGAVYMNARAYGGQMSDVVTAVHYLDSDLNLQTASVEQLQYSYKDSLFLRNPKLFIYQVELKLTVGDREQIASDYKKASADREEKGQYLYPSAGCIFKNCRKIGIPTGKLIDELGLKGHRIGGAEVYKKHGNFIFNVDNATAKDVIELIEFIEREALDKRNIELEREIRIIL